MLNLKKLKNDNDEGQMQPLDLGFKEETPVESYSNKFKRAVKVLNDEAKYGGFYTNVWMWNMVFVNFSISLILWVVISSSISKLPENIGVNIDDTTRLDTIINSGNLYLLPIYHLVVAVIVLIFGIKAHKRLDHLFIVGLLQTIVLAPFELFALRNLITYFL